MQIMDAIFETITHMLAFVSHVTSPAELQPSEPDPAPIPAGFRPENAGKQPPPEGAASSSGTNSSGPGSASHAAKPAADRPSSSNQDSTHTACCSSAVVLCCRAFSCLASTMPDSRTEDLRTLLPHLAAWALAPEAVATDDAPRVLPRLQAIEACVLILHRVVLAPKAGAGEASPKVWRSCAAKPQVLAALLALVLVVTKPGIMGDSPQGVWMELMLSNTCATVDVLVAAVTVATEEALKEARSLLAAAGADQPSLFGWLPTGQYDGGLGASAASVAALFPALSKGLVQTENRVEAEMMASHVLSFGLLLATHLQRPGTGADGGQAACEALRFAVATLLAASESLQNMELPALLSLSDCMWQEAGMEAFLAKLVGVWDEAADDQLEQALKLCASVSTAVAANAAFAAFVAEQSWLSAVSRQSAAYRQIDAALERVPSTTALAVALREVGVR